MDPCRSPERFWCCADAKTQDLVGIYGVRKTLFLSPSFPSAFFTPTHPFFTPLPLHHNTLSQSALISPDNIMYFINKYIYIFVSRAKSRVPRAKLRLYFVKNSGLTFRASLRVPLTTQRSTSPFIQSEYNYQGLICQLAANLPMA